MKKLIENIRQQPHHQKSRIVWIIAGCVAGLLLIVWAIIGIPDREGGNTDVIKQFSNDIEENKDTLPQLFDNTK